MLSAVGYDTRIEEVTVLDFTPLRVREQQERGRALEPGSPLPAARLPRGGRDQP